jgi:hypothetical protein
LTAPPKLLGTYRTPKFRVGDVVKCARRGDVRITGVSDAPIPWPLGQTLPKGNARSLVLYGDLVEAVKRESAAALMHFWGVGHHTVWVWRKALGVSQYNEGTSALKSERLTPVLRRACEASRPTWASPERRAKISAARRASPGRRTSSRRCGRAGKGRRGAAESHAAPFRRRPPCSPASCC